MHEITGNQPQPVKQRIYGSQKVEPLDSANQPGVLPHVKPRGVKVLPTVRVKLKGDDKELIVNESDFDSAKHERLD